jgi:excisionase family DNA binding protein
LRHPEIHVGAPRVREGHPDRLPGGHGVTIVVEEAVIRRIVAEEIAKAMPGAALPELVTRDEVAGWLRIHPRDLRRLVLAGEFPAGIKVGRRLRWRKTTLEKWLDAGEKNRLHVRTMTGALG